MAIEFRCPNGHRLSCPEDRAGKPATCPKCGTAFRVPNGQPDGSGHVALAGGEGQGEAAAVAQAGTAQNEDLIVFYCPNGHKLNGPASLQGKPGQCPNCGAKFRIPVQSPEQDGAATAEPHAALPETEEQEHWDELEEFEEVEEITESRDQFVPPDIEPDADSDAPSFFLPEEDLADMHPLARLFHTLWNERQHGGIIEVHLSDGTIIMPDWWARKLSLDTHAVFALQTADGSYVMESVAWDAVKRISVRRITELPDGVFE